MSPDPTAKQGTTADKLAALLARTDGLRVVFDHVQDVVFLIAVEGDDAYRFIAINPAFSRATGLTAAQVEGRLVREVIPEPSVDEVLLHYREAIRTRLPVFWEEITPYPTGTRHGEVMIAPVFDEGGRCIHLVGTVHDVTPHREAQAALERLANYDPLTHLPNRAFFRSSLDADLGWCERNGRSLVLAYLDLDGFKRINDALGHSVGDRLLHALGDRLRSTCRGHDLVARLGGDEFAVIAQVEDAQAEAVQLARRLLAEVARPVCIDGADIAMTASVGLAVGPSDARNSEDLIRFADTAMYHAKRSGRGGMAFYSNEMDERMQRHREMEQALRRALDGREFALHYQPQWCLGSGRLTGLEALLRWRRPDGPPVGPAEFIPLLEETGLIRPLGRWIITEACRQLADWRRRGLPIVPVAVNVSGCQLDGGRRATLATLDAGDDDGELVHHVGACLAAEGLPGHWLELEVTESVLMDDPDQARECLLRVRALGVRVHIDDFGTGYSSLSYLKRLPIDSLKIDRGFVKELPDARDDRAVVQAIVQLAHSLGLQVIAEGVETEAQHRLLAELGCDRGQGYYYGAPIPAAQIDALLEAGCRETH